MIWMVWIMADVILRGVFFAPGEPYVTRAFLHKAQDRVANEAERKIHAFQNLLFRYQSSPKTGYYERHIVNRDLGSRHIITDSDVVYGPWLEGIGSRNYPVTRFKGYAIFRRTARDVQSRADELVAPIIKELCEALNR